MKKFPLGKGMPVLGLGTWKAAPGEVGQAVKEAIALGYRHLDCAAIYGNESEIGQALADCFDAGTVTREDLWITSKLWNDAHHPDDVVPALKKTLSELRLDSLDLYLIHWPVVHRPGVVMPSSADEFIPLAELPTSTTWQALEKAVDQGLAKHIGVSNFSVKKLKELLKSSRIKPAVNQIEMHPYLQQQDMVDFCQAHGVYLTAYSPLGSMDRPKSMKSAGEPILLDDPTIKAIAKEHGITAAQVLLAWAVERGTSTIPKSVKPKRLAENLAAADIHLNENAMHRIAQLDKNRRYLDGSFWAENGSPYTVAELWDE